MNNGKCGGLSREDQSLIVTNERSYYDVIRLYALEAYNIRLPQHRLSRVHVHRVDVRRL